MAKAKPVRRSLQILQERSAVPSLSSHTTKAYATKKKITAADKERLLRIARKNNVSSDGHGLGSAVITTGTAARGENLRDVWDEVDEVPEVPEGEWGREGKPAPKPKAPIALQRQRELLLVQTADKALPIPHAGLSYNPGLDSHQELLERAFEEEKQKLAREEEERKRLAIAESFVVVPEYTEGFALGMQVDDAAKAEEEAEAQEEGDADGEPIKRKAQRRKTQLERNKAQRAREAVSWHQSLRGRISLNSIRLTAPSSPSQRVDQAVTAVPGGPAVHHQLAREGAVRKGQGGG